MRDGFIKIAAATPDLHVADCEYNAAEIVKQAKQAAAVAAERKSQIGSGDRSERVRTYNFPQNRVTDHRLTGDNKNFNIAAIMNGNLDPLIDALVTADQAEKLRAQSEA